MRRDVHYERALHAYFREKRVPCVVINEARRSLLPGGHGLDGGSAKGGSLKSFDFLVYAGGAGGSSVVLVDVKGRLIAARGRRRMDAGLATARLESWVTSDDVAALLEWEKRFGADAVAVFVFVYWCVAQPPDPLFEEVFEHQGRWYALRAVTVREFARRATPRSEKWRTIQVERSVFDRISMPLSTGLRAWGSLPSESAAHDPGPESVFGVE